MVKTLWLRSSHDGGLLWRDSLHSSFLPLLQSDSGAEAGRILREDPRVSILVFSEHIEEEKLTHVSEGLRDRGKPLEVIILSDRDETPSFLLPFLDHFEIAPWCCNPVRDDARLESLLEQVSHKALAMRELYEMRLGHIARHGFLGRSTKSHELAQKLIRASQSDQTILILGEDGSGKCEAAALIHELSPSRCLGPMVYVSAETIAAEDAAVRIFGTYKGGHRPAQAEEGLIHRASGGILLLQDIHNASQSLQMRLVDMLSQGKLFRVGSAQPEPVDVQLIVTASGRISRLAASQAFRQDLLNQLAAHPVEIPPLRERPEDVPPLARHFAQRVVAAFAPSHVFPGFTPEAEELLAKAAWPRDRASVRHFVRRFLLLGGIEAEKPVSAVELEDDLAAWLRAAEGHRRGEEDLLPLGFLRQMGLDYDRAYHECLASFLAIERRRRSKQEIAALFGKSPRWLEITMNSIAKWMLEHGRRTPEELQRDNLWSRRFRPEGGKRQEK